MKNESAQTFSVQLSHVAILVSSVEKSALKLTEMGFKAGPPEKWDGEGTLEIYFGEDGESGRLLLMQPFKEGAYSRALAKRGSGLHHIGVDVDNLDAFIDSLSGSGWYLHPTSLKTIKKSQTAWLARPDTPALIEVHSREKVMSASCPAFINTLAVPMQKRLIDALCIPSIVFAEGRQCWFKIAEKRVVLSEVLS